MLSKRFLFCQKFGSVDDAKQKKKKDGRCPTVLIHFTSL